jgi:hypothetical protein
MTMVSFRLDAGEVAEADRRAAELGLRRADLLREALRRHLVHLAGEADAEAWRALPLTEDERSLAFISDWGPAEDWSDWADAPR